MRTRPANRLRSERGATLVHVAIALVTLMGLAAYAVDRGIVWVSRGQAQNAADAGALAGAVARAWDDDGDPPAPGDPAERAALAMAADNPVWGTPGSANVSWTCPTDVTGRCVRVDVYRNGEFGSATLPVVFAPVLGITSQGIRATATAVVNYGNTVNCMRPFSVPDKWIENLAPSDEYNHWVVSGGDRGTELANPDVYAPGSEGTGWDADDSDGSSDIGTQFILKIGNNPQSDGVSIQSGWSFPVRLPDHSGNFCNGGDCYRDAIAGCTAGPVSIGDYLPVENGVMNGPTTQGVGDLVDLDPDAMFVGTPTPHIDGSCAPGCNPFSPRIVPISVFDVEQFQWSQAHNDWGYCPGAPAKCIKVVQILGFFVEGMSGGDVVGRLMMYPGELISGPTAPSGSEFLVKIQLVR